MAADQVVLTVGYDIESLANPEIRRKYKGPVTKDWYGRSVPKHAHGTENLLSESEIAVLNDRLQQLIRHLPEHPEEKITWFRPDERKRGGAYITTTGTVKKLSDQTSKQGDIS